MKKNEVKTVAEVINDEVSKGKGKQTKTVEEKKTPQQIEAEKMQEEINRKTKELQKCLQELERKKTLSDHRAKFIKILDSLDSYEEKMNEEPVFESSLFRLSFDSTSNYRSEPLFTVSNQEILKQFISFIRERIHVKIDELEKMIID